MNNLTLQGNYGGGQPLAGSSLALSLGSSNSSSSGNPYDTPAIPPWLQSGADSAVGPLKNELANTDKYYDVSKYLKALTGAAQGQYGIDLQQGQNAAREQVARSYQNGTFGSQNSSMIAAQTALPGMQNLLKTKEDAAQIQLKAQEDNQTARANIAKAIADARTSYTSTLAGYITNTRGQNITGSNNQLALGIQQQGVDNQQQQLWATIMNNPQSNPQARAWAAKQLGIPAYYPGSVGSTGAIMPTSVPSPNGMGGNQVAGIY